MNENNAFLFQEQRVTLQEGDVISYSQTLKQLSFKRNGEPIGIQFQRQKIRSADAIEMPKLSSEQFTVICNLLAANRGLKTERYQENPWMIQLVAG